MWCKCRVVDSKHRLLAPIQRSLVNPVVRTAWAIGLGPPGDALLETTGRQTGRPRLTPISDCLESDTFWLVSQRGRRTDYVRNLESNPRVRVRVRRGLGTHLLAGTAHVMDGDDPTERRRHLLQGNAARALCLRAANAMLADPEAP